MARRVWLFWLLSVLLTTSVGWMAHTGDIRSEQRRLGQELATQLARSSAPWLLSRDMTSLNLLLAGLDARPGLSQVEIIDGDGRRLVATSPAGIPGQRISRDIQLGEQPLGQLVLTLREPLLTDWLREHLMPLGLMAALQLLCFVLAGRRTGSSNAHVPALPVAPPPAPASPFRPGAPLPGREALICVQPHDERDLLRRLSHHLLSDIFEIMNQLLERVARLSGGELVRAMSSQEPALLRLSGVEQPERVWQAVCAAALALRLAERAGMAREAEGLLWLPMKAGLHCRPGDQAESVDIPALLACAAPAQQLLVSGRPELPGSVARRARWGTCVQLDIPGQGRLLATALVTLEAEADAAVAAQAERLVPLSAGTAENGPDLPA